MTIAQWLSTREPAAPPALARRIAELTATLDPTGGDAAAECLLAAERALPFLVSSEDDSRRSALDLLAIDALVTYAFEAASAQPERIPELADSAMVRLSSLAPPA